MVSAIVFCKFFNYLRYLTKLDTFGLVVCTYDKFENGVIKNEDKTIFKYNKNIHLKETIAYYLHILQ